MGIVLDCVGEHLEAHAAEVAGGGVGGVAVQGMLLELLLRCGVDTAEGTQPPPTQLPPLTMGDLQDKGHINLSMK